MKALALKVEEVLRARDRLGAPASAPRLLERGERTHERCGRSDSVATGFGDGPPPQGR
jgi:hypothetical protein